MAPTGHVEQALDQADEVELTVTGRVSGRPSSRPVWVVRDGERVYLLAAKGSDSQWFKNVRANPTVRIRVSGETITGLARPITDAVGVQDVVDKFRHKYGAADLKRYFAKLDAAAEVPLV
jgi:deazaflavin-dependent oxidoreductase (nitroreductase family)